MAYTSGGLLGLLLLVLRLKTTDSSLFERAKQMHQQRGKLAWLLSRPILRRRFLMNLFVGLPIWLVSGVLIYFAPELSHELGITTPVSVSEAIFWSYAGTIYGDIFSGIASQLWRSRIKVIFVYLMILATAILIYGLGVKGCSAFQFKLVCFLLGLGTGDWVLFPSWHYFAGALHTLAGQPPYWAWGDFAWHWFSLHFLNCPKLTMSNLIFSRTNRLNRNTFLWLKM